MALKSLQQTDAGPDAQELIDELEKLIDRTKVMYEQYFMGIQKLAPAQLHNDVERKMRELTQTQIRNTAQRYRFSSLQQKFGSYNTYWKRTLREIEQGRYLRSLQRVGRQAARTGAEIPEEILAAMPKRMREQIARDREAALAIAKRQGRVDAAINAPPSQRSAPNTGQDARGNYLLSGDEDLDLDDLFGAIVDESAPDPVPEPPAQRAVTQPAQSAALPRGLTTPPPLPRKPAMVPPAIPRVSKPAAIPSIATSSTRTSAEPTPTAPPQPTKAPRAGTEIGSGVSPQGRGPSSIRPRPVVGSAVPPPGMTDAEVRALYTNYVKARELVGQKSDANTYAQLLKTISAQAPKIMQQYKAEKVEFGVVVKDNQVILKAKPKSG